ncbi:MAG TPA: glycine zipper 2TM domain-containing protein [Frateuria sp.]|uniref:glycine zipper 2TM domain-containing protein n=1 Tax=Frateuria sp. TaxID=2211372 RepID=UPI002DF5ABAC|nr:glycine zipper 2TM domain-containing protein [Frateuria sp.]
MAALSRNSILGVVLTASLALGGCATPYGNGGYRDHGGYQSSDYGSARCQNCGVVQDIQQVYVQGEGHGTLGAVIGAVAGGVLGNQVGKGNGRKAATVAGAVAGGVIGNQVGKRSGSGDQPAWRITLRLDNGQYATVTQSEDPGLRVGDYAQVRGDHVYAM